MAIGAANFEISTFKSISSLRVDGVGISLDREPNI